MTSASKVYRSSRGILTVFLFWQKLLPRLFNPGFQMYFVEGQFVQNAAVHLHLILYNSLLLQTKNC